MSDRYCVMVLEQNGAYSCPKKEWHTYVVCESYNEALIEYSRAYASGNFLNVKIEYFNKSRY